MFRKNPTVSVIIPTYNYARYLPRAVESVLNQTYRDIELIVVDDGSTDNTPDIMKDYLASPSVHYVKKENGGQASAKNKGIHLARGDFIAFLDADDIWFREKLELQVPLFTKDPRIGVVYSRRICIDPWDKPLPTRRPKLHRGNILNKLYVNNFICFSSSVVRYACFQELGLFDEELRLSEDYDFWIRVASSYFFEFVDSPLVYYRTGHSSTGSGNAEKVFTTVLGIMRKYASRSDYRISFLSRAYGFSDTYKHMAWYYRKHRSASKVLETYFVSLLYFPLNIWAWFSLIHYLIIYPGLKLGENFKH